MQTNLSRTGQMAISNDQMSNPLRLLKAKLKNGDTWQQGTNYQADSYPQTQPVKPSQSPLYPKSDYDFYTMKQQQTNSQPKMTDPRTLNYQQLQQYKQQQPPPTQIIKNDPYLGMNAMNRLNYYDQMQKYKQQEDPYKKNNPQSYYDQQQNKKQISQQPQKYYDELLKQPLSYNNNYEFSQNKYDYTQNNNPLYQQQSYNNNNNNNNFSWGLNNNNNQKPNNYYPQQNNYPQNNYGLSNYGQQQLSNYGQQQQQQQFSNYQLNQQQSKNYNKYDDYNQQSQYNQQNNQYQQQNTSSSPFKQQPQQQQYKSSQHNSQPSFERRDRQFDRQQEQTKQEQPIRKQQPPQNYNKNYKNPLDEIPAVAKKNPIDDLPAVAKKNPNNQFPPEDDDADLVDCPEGCGRRFKEDVLDKHVKVCKKVFQSKRKEFNSKAHRQVNQEQVKLEKMGQVKDKIIEKKKQMAQNGEPKWKKQSEAFRQMIKASKTGDTVDIQQPDDLVECPSCGRKFNESAAERHIPGCKKRNFKR